MLTTVLKVYRYDIIAQYYVIIRATLKPTNIVIALHCHLFLVSNSFSLGLQSTGKLIKRDYISFIWTDFHGNVVGCVTASRAFF